MRSFLSHKKTLLVFAIVLCGCRDGGIETQKTWKSARPTREHNDWPEYDTLLAIRNSPVSDRLKLLNDSVKYPGAASEFNEAADVFVNTCVGLDLAIRARVRDEIYLPAVKSPPGNRDCRRALAAIGMELDLADTNDSCAELMTAFIEDLSVIPPTKGDLLPLGLYHSLRESSDNWLANADAEKTAESLLSCRNGLLKLQLQSRPMMMRICLGRVLATEGKDASAGILLDLSDSELEEIINTLPDATTAISKQVETRKVIEAQVAALPETPCIHGLAFQSFVQGYCRQNSFQHKRMFETGVIESPEAIESAFNERYDGPLFRNQEATVEYVQNMWTDVHWERAFKECGIPQRK